jgi:hypothetical protein
MKLVFSFILVLSIFHVKAQEYTIKRNQFFDFVLSSKMDLTNLSFQKPISFLQQHEGKNARFHRYINKIGNDVYLTTEGYGEVYKFVDVKNDYLYLNRIDSTIFSGNNFNSSFFIYNDKIHSFGGYGYWRFNGQLRQFSEGFEWDIIKLNKEVPLNTSLSIFDSSSKSLFFVQKKYVDESFGVNYSVSTVNKLDIENRIIENLGSLDVELEKSIIESPYVVQLNKPFGIVLLHQNKWILLNLKENKRYELNNGSLVSKLFGNSYYTPDVFYNYKDSIITYSHKVDSILKFQISERDFKDLLQEAYIKQNNNYTLYFIILFCFLVITTIVFFYKRKYKKSHAKPPTHTEKPIKAKEDIFNQVEKDLIEMIYSVSNSNEQVTVDHVNKILGLSKKNIEVQKRTRREVINSINYKYKKVSGRDSDFIQSIRSENDKRYMNYFISKSNWESYLLLKK